MNGRSEIVINDANPVKIRLAVASDLPFLPAIENSASHLFGSIPDLSFIANDSPISIDILNSYLSSNHLWVATHSSSSGDIPVAFIATKCMSGALDEGQYHIGKNDNRTKHMYIVECSVQSSYQRHGIASQLFGVVEQSAREQGFGYLTLVTFLDIAWNGKFYKKLGFEEASAQAMGDEYVALLREEASNWKDWKPEIWKRGVMVRRLV